MLQADDDAPSAREHRCIHAILTPIDINAPFSPTDSRLHNGQKVYGSVRVLRLEQGQIFPTPTETPHSTVVEYAIETVGGTSGSWTIINNGQVSGNATVVFTSPGQYRAIARKHWRRCTNPPDCTNLTVYFSSAWTDYADCVTSTIDKATIDEIHHGDVRVDVASHNGYLSPLPYGPGQPWNDNLRFLIGMTPEIAVWPPSVFTLPVYVQRVDIDRSELDPNDSYGTDADGDLMAEGNRTQTTRFEKDDNDWDGDRVYGALLTASYVKCASVNVLVRELFDRTHRRLSESAPDKGSATSTVNLESIRNQSIVILTVYEDPYAMGTCFDLLEKQEYVVRSYVLRYLNAVDAKSDEVESKLQQLIDDPESRMYRSSSASRVVESIRGGEEK